MSRTRALSEAVRIILGLERRYRDECTTAGYGTLRALQPTGGYRVRTVCTIAQSSLAESQALEERARSLSQDEARLSS